MTIPARIGKSLNRPLGYFPRGTSLGLAGWALLAAGVPIGVLICAAPLMVGGVHRLLASIPYVLGFALLPLFVWVAGARSHKYWTVCLFFFMGVALVGAYVPAVLFALAGVAGVFTVRDPDLRVGSFVGLIYLLVMSPAAWFLLRALRLRYWQPNSTPDQWEPGDETPPAWALSPTRNDRR